MNSGDLSTGFTYDSAVPRVIFGAGSRRLLSAEIERLGTERLLIIATEGRASVAAEVTTQLGDRVAASFHGARQHVPVDVVQEARGVAESADCDGYLAIGGGSAIGLAKALTLESGLPIVAMPTTYSGSEMTPVWGLTSADGKRTGRDARVLARTVIYDPALTSSLPPKLAAASALNAIAHCVEALYAPDANPLTSLLAEEGVRALASALPSFGARPDEAGHQSDAMFGAFLGGMSLAAVSMGLHHRLCHMLGGTFGLPHAASHAVMLPHVIAWEERGGGEWLRRLASALDSGDPSTAIYRLRAAASVVGSLRELGLASQDLVRAVEHAGAMTGRTGVALGADAAVLLEDAYTGRAPRRWTDQEIR